MALSWKRPNVPQHVDRRQAARWQRRKLLQGPLCADLAPVIASPYRNDHLVTDSADVKFAPNG